MTENRFSPTPNYWDDASSCGPMMNNAAAQVYGNICNFIHVGGTENGAVWGELTSTAIPTGAANVWYDPAQYQWWTTAPHFGPVYVYPGVQVQPEPSNHTGWICPRCKAVNAPDVKKCDCKE